MRGGDDLDSDSSRENGEKWSDSEYFLELDLTRFSNGFGKDYKREKSRITPSFLLEEMDE